MLGSLSADSTHIALRVSLKAEVPIVNSASTDPTIPETIIPWYLTTIQDDRVQSYTLARRIYTDLGSQAHRAPARQFALRPFRRAQVQGRLPAARTSGRHRAEVHARRHGLPAATAHHQRVAGGRHRDLGRPAGGGHHTEANARGGDEAAGVRQLPHDRRRTAGLRRPRGRGTGGGLSVRSDSRRSRSGSLSSNVSGSASTRSRKCLRRWPTTP